MQGKKSFATIFRKFQIYEGFFFFFFFDIMDKLEVLKKNNSFTTEFGKFQIYNFCRFLLFLSFIFSKLQNPKSVYFLFFVTFVRKAKAQKSIFFCHLFFQNSKTRKNKKVNFK